MKVTGFRVSPTGPQKSNMTKPSCMSVRACVVSTIILLTGLDFSLQMSPPPSSFNEPRSGGGSGGPLSHFYSGSPNSYFTSGLQAGLKQSHLNKVRSLPHQGLGPVFPCLVSKGFVIQGASDTAPLVVGLTVLLMVEWQWAT